MFRRLSVALSGLLVAGLLTTGSAAADHADEPRELTSREQAGLEFAGEVLRGLFGRGAAVSNWPY
ncbi:hypothetical protein [Streptomyces sp. NPDC002187]|uniref:hypothetical protein n=1 Tax=Streptomyces sp. NPDC002187 TaxID=3364637 RepID=UPI0036B6197D